MLSRAIILSSFLSIHRGKQPSLRHLEVLHKQQSFHLVLIYRTLRVIELSISTQSKLESSICTGTDVLG